MAGMQSGLVILTALLLSGSVAVAQAGKPLRQRYQDTVRRHSARRRPDQGLHKIAFDRVVANLPGSRPHGGGDRKGVQDRCYETVCRHCAGHRRYQSLHKIAHGRGERSLQGCDVPGRGGQEDLGGRGSLKFCGGRAAARDRALLQCRPLDHLCSRLAALPRSETGGFFDRTWPCRPGIPGQHLRQPRRDFLGGDRALRDSSRVDCRDRAGGCGAKSFAGRYPRSGTIRRLECT